jgi:hypothetical protein
MRAFFCLTLVGAAACASAPSQTTTSPAPARDTAQGDIGRGGTSTPNADPFPSTYVPFPSRTTVIRSVNILTAAGPIIRNGAILLQNGKIAAVGASVDAPADALVIDGAGKYVTPGIIDDRAGRQCTQRRQRGNESNDAAGVGRAFGMAAGSPVSAQSRWGSYDAAGAARFGEPDRRAKRSVESRTRTHRAGNEVSRREVRIEDGLR